MDNGEQAFALIDQSQCNDEVMHHPYSSGLAKELETRANGSIDTVETFEFWGDDWRVHLERSEEELKAMSIKQLVVIIEKLNLGSEEEFNSTYESFKEFSEL